MQDFQAITHALSETGKSRILVLGDYALDKYLYIDPKRDEPSIETGLTAYQIHAKRMSAGAGGNVVSNLRALGATVHLIENPVTQISSTVLPRLPADNPRHSRR